MLAGKKGNLKEKMFFSRSLRRGKNHFYQRNRFKTKENIALDIIYTIYIKTCLI